MLSLSFEFRLVPRCHVLNKVFCWFERANENNLIYPGEIVICALFLQDVPERWQKCSSARVEEEEKNNRLLYKSLVYLDHWPHYQTSWAMKNITKRALVNNWNMSPKKEFTVVVSAFYWRLEIDFGVSGCRAVDCDEGAVWGFCVQEKTHSHYVYLILNKLHPQFSLTVVLVTPCCA